VSPSDISIMVRAKSIIFEASISLFCIFNGASRECDANVSISRKLCCLFPQVRGFRCLYPHTDTILYAPIWGTMRLCDINRIAVDSFIMFWNVWVENGSVTSHGVLEPWASIIIRQSFDHRVEVDTSLGTGARWMMATSSKVCEPPQPTSSEK
jgi:hypothetical protein